ncbi:MAG TPA: cytosine permease [Pseudomonadales bacterium]|nr:cytosine permease [Pseudomonadales bacterium]
MTSDSAVAAVENLADAHTRSPVPEADTVSGFQVGMVCVGIAITLPALYTGGTLARGLGLADAVSSVLVGALLLSIMSVPSAIVGVRTRLSSYMVIEHVFGWGGAKLLNGCFAIVLLGWYAVTAELFGRTLAIAAADFGLVELPEWLWILVSSAIVTATTLFGFKALDRLALLAVPPLTLVLCWMVFEALGERSFAELLAIPGEGMPFTEGVSVVIGAMIVNVVLMPDLTRYARTDRDAFVAAFLGNGGGIVVSTLLAMIPALAFGVLDPMAQFTLLGIGLLALVVLVFATWTTNGVNLYSTGLVAGSALPKAGYVPITLVGGVLGTALALYGVADRLTDFLVLLGLVVPPVAGVYLTRFFLLGETDFSEAHFAARPMVDVAALTACLLAGAIGLWAWMQDLSLTGVAPIESLLLAGLLYLAAERLQRLRAPAALRQG